MPIEFDVATWLRDLGLGQYAPIFEANDVDQQTIRLLTESDLLEIGVKLVGHRRKLAEAIAGLRATPVAKGGGSTLAEHRQLTVLYCEISVSATSASLCAERLREVTQAFHQACTRSVAEFDGHVANFYGDCLLAYFGWPQAHEDDAERAVRAGLALTHRLPGLIETGEALSARVGIATGDVVVGDLILHGPAQEQSAVGLAPNLGARLLALASPGQVVIDELTRQLLPPSYAFQPLGRHVLKGIREPVAAYAVSGERLADSRFDAQQGQAPAPMIGREQELALLLERWSLARGGEGQVILLAGEAGIGKSRLTHALLDACTAQPHALVRWQCSPYHTGGALWPVIRHLGLAAGLDTQDSTEQALDKLEGLAGRHHEAVALYATLLGLNGAQRYGPIEMTPQMLRERTLELLVEQLFEAAQAHPLLLLVEDAHWIDPMTLELIERCLASIEQARMLVVITSRSEDRPKLAAYPSATQLSLNRLGRTHADAIVSRLSGEALPRHAVAAIVARADGIPLFVEELTKAALKTGEFAIPSSLHGSLMARLDRTPDVKAVAQVAACVGREFDRALVRAVVERREAVDEALDNLVATESVFRRSGGTNRFIFKHALVQEAAYQSLLRGQRQAIHARILKVLEGDKSTPQEILAYHAARAKAGRDCDSIQRLRSRVML